MGMLEPAFESMNWISLIMGVASANSERSLWNSGMEWRNWMMLFNEHKFLSSPPFFNNRGTIESPAIVMQKIALSLWDVINEK